MFALILDPARFQTKRVRYFVVAIAERATKKTRVRFPNPENF